MIGYIGMLQANRQIKQQVCRYEKLIRDMSGLWTICNNYGPLIIAWNARGAEESLRESKKNDKRGHLRKNDEMLRNHPSTKP